MTEHTLVFLDSSCSVSSMKLKINGCFSPAYRLRGTCRSSNKAGPRLNIYMTQECRLFLLIIPPVAVPLRDHEINGSNPNADTNFIPLF